MDSETRLNADLKVSVIFYVLSLVSPFHCQMGLRYGECSGDSAVVLGNESFLRAATEGGGWADFHIRCVLYCLLEKRGNTRLNLALNRLNQSFGALLNASTA